MSQSWDLRCQKAQDEVDVARAQWVRYRRAMRSLAAAAMFGVALLLCGCATAGVSSFLDLGAGGLAPAMIIPGAILGVTFGLLAAFASDPSERGDHPQDVLRAAERKLRDALMDQGSS